MCSSDLGALPGAWLRFWLVRSLEPFLVRRHWGTLVVNLLACFALGLLVAHQARLPHRSHVMLLVGTGFLGSLSTFSSFASELRLCLQQGERVEAAGLLLASTLGGLLALRAGWILF